MNQRDLATRLRAADPLQGLAATEGSASLFERIVGTGHERAPKRHGRHVRRPLLLAGVALLVACGLATAATVSVHYFADAGSQRLPDPVRLALETQASHFGPVGKLDLDQTITADTFTSTSARGRVYVAPHLGSSGFCAALAPVGKPVAVTCAPTFAGQVETLGGLQPWSLALTPDMHAMLGRLSPRAAGETVRLAFEDGTTVDLPMRDRWFAYAVVDRHTQVGHRPVALRFLRDGKLVRRSRLDPVSFNTLAAARALVPASNGAFPQNVIRRQLLDALGSRMGDGGQTASRTQIAHTTLVASAVAGGRRISVYATPIAPLRAGDPEGLLVTGLVTGIPHPVFYDESVGASGGAGLQLGFTAGVGVPGHPGARSTVIEGTMPTSIPRVTVQMSDGSERRATTFAHGTHWLLLTPGARVRPVAVVGRDGAGTVVVTQPVLGQAGAYRRSG